jgi:hypothetical protein
MAANLTPSIRLPPDEFNRTADTGRADLVDALMISLSRFASPSTSSPFSTTIVLFSLERVVVKSAADADRHAAAAATNTNANMLLDIARCPARPRTAWINYTHRSTPTIARKQFHRTAQSRSRCSAKMVGLFPRLQVSRHRALDPRGQHAALGSHRGRSGGAA